MPRPLRFRWLALALPLALAAAEPREKPAPPRDPAKLIDVLFAAPFALTPKMSPDGSHLAFLREVKGVIMLATYDFKERRIAHVAGSGNHDIYDFHWTSPDALIFAVGVHNVFHVGHWTADENLKGNKPVNTDRWLVVTDALPQDPENVLMQYHPLDTLHGPLLRLNLPSGNISILEKNPGKVVGWLADRAGHPRLAVATESESRFSYLYREPGEKTLRPLALPELSHPLAFDRTGANLLLVRPGPDDRQIFQTYDLAAKKLGGQPITDPIHDVYPDIFIDPATNEPAGIRYAAEQTRVVWFSEEYGRIHSQLSAAYPRAVVELQGYTHDKRMLFRLVTDTEPAAYYLYHLEKAQVSRLFSTLPTADAFGWSPRKPVQFAARDGHTVHGYLTLPRAHPSGQPAPAITLVHGGPFYRDTWGFDAEAQFYAALGYAVLQVNYRGSSGYGKGHALPDIITVGEKSVDDVADGLRWLVAEGIADRQRLVAVGGSYGGYITLALATRYPDLLTAAVGSAGVYDWEKEIRADAREFNDIFQWRRDYYPDPKKNAARYRAISPVHEAGNIRCPVLLLHGHEDRVVDITQSNHMARALKKAGKSVAVVKDAEGIHGFPDEKSRRNFYSQVAAFLARHVPVSAP